MLPPQASISLEQHAQQQQHNGATLAHKVKTPTVQQALPFTPFTSIIPFDPSIIKIPTSSTVKAKDINILDKNSLKSSRHLLSKLSAGATRAETASEQCQRTLHDVQKLLSSNNLTQFKFRKPVQRSKTFEEKAAKVEPARLSSFARMVFDSVPIEIEYASASSSATAQVPAKATPTSQPVSQRNGTHNTTQAVTKALVPSAVNQNVHQYNMTTGNTNTLPLTNGQSVVAVSGKSSGIISQQPQAHYETAQHPVVRVSAGTNATIHVDQKAKGQASVQVLTSLLTEIFDAEDSILAGDDLSNEILSIFRFRDTDNAPSHLLAPAYQTKLENAVQKAASAGRLGSIPTEYLKRAQKVCDDVVQSSADLSLQPQDGWSEAEVEDWEQHLHAAETSLLAVRTLLKIMTAGSADRELQSEDLVRSLLKVMRDIAETGIVAIVETHGEKKRDNADATSRFAVALDHHDQILVVLRGFTKALRSLTALLAKVQVDESAISSIVYMCRLLVFAENAASDKESILGVQTYEGSRRYAMEVLARVFDKYPGQRQFIFDEILLSLEKLPGTKQSARQYRLPDAKPIQLVSALIMQLIQTSATRGGSRLSASQADNEAEESSENEFESEDDLARRATPSKKDQSKDLHTLITPLDHATQGSAMYVTKTLVARALNTAKNADEPHRKLLDIFTEDFLNVLGLPEWPSSELLLRSLLRQMLAIVDNKKSGVPARNFALESLSRMGSGILDIQGQVQSYSKPIAAGNSEIADRLSNMLQQTIDGAPIDDLLHLEGPYRVMLEYLHGKRSNEAQIHTAIGFDLLQWASQICNARDGSAEPDSNERGSTKGTQSQLRSMLLDSQWFETNTANENITPAEGRLAALVITTNSPFCKAFPKIFNVLLTNMTSEHATVKSKSLRSVITLIETDPTVLDRNTYILRSILRCAEDNSPLVRDAALGLVARCMVLRPALDAKTFEHIILRMNDSAIGVRKRSMKMLKDIYLRNDIASMRSSIATAIVGRIKDIEESVVELAKHTIEEIWFQPLYASALRDQSKASVEFAYRSQALLLVQAVELSDDMPEALTSLLRELLQSAKSSKDNIAVSKELVDVLFNGIIDSTGFSESISQGMLLQVLAVFAQASPKLLTASQLQLLQPYVHNLSSNEDLAIFSLALSILRHAMPYASDLQAKFLTDLQKDLLRTMGKLPVSEYPEVAACLWTIDGELKNTELLVNTVSQILANIRKHVGQDLNDEMISKRLTRFLSLAGQLGKACDLEAHLTKVKSKVPGAKSNSVAGIIVETLIMFETAEQALNIRQAALESICAVCQRWPKQFLRADVNLSFDRLLAEKHPVLESVFLEGLLSFFKSQETSTSGIVDPEAGATGRERLAKTYVASDQDGATTELSQRYLQYILRLATASVDDTALTATKLVASMVRQGLPHPKECGPSLIALETSPNSAIAKIACAEHRTMHEKHETIIEKEYVRSMDNVLLYQSNTIGDIRGWTGSPPAAKLCFFWDVLRGGKAKVRQKFLSNICLKLSFEPSKLDCTQSVPTHLSFVRFMIENLALFEFDRTDDLKLLIDGFSKVFATIGTALAQTIDSELFNMNVATLESSQLDSQQVHVQAAPQIESSRLKVLATSAQILLLIDAARAFLVRCWGGQKLLKKEKGKDTSKAPTRASTAAALSEAFVKRLEQLMVPCIDQTSQTSMCRAFAEVVSTDHEIDVASEDEERFDDERSQSRDPRSPSVALTGTPSGRKRKSSSQGGGGPKKRGRPCKTPSFTRLDDEDAEGEWE